MDSNAREQERRRYINAFNSTMVKIWKERIVMLGAVDTGALYHSLIGIGMTADGKYIDISLSQSFNAYGIFVDYGTGSNTPRGNPGDIGRSNRRVRKNWFSRKYYASVMNLQEFMADNLGKQFCAAVSNALNPDVLRDSISK